MKKSVLLLVALLALSGIMAAMAYNGATVRSAGTLTVATSNNALLAVIPNHGTNNSVTGNKDMTAKVTNSGVVEFVFGRGQGEVDFGLQQGSTYRWDNLFSVKNNSSEAIECQFKMPASLGKYIAIQDGSNNFWVPSDVSPTATGYVTYGRKFELAPGASKAFRLDVDIWAGRDVSNAYAAIPGTVIDAQVQNHLDAALKDGAIIVEALVK